ncbi:chemotaxis protein CheW [Methylobacterium planeticum]|uniref:Chemotaxis protein CheW n=1 Tax=Methylobacterium planeticum TaxID=2615211 RepID=A0A6N6MQH0_9HYPH|nr:chemotaxis protein CheW [Methylobacterium planeticum]KAB1072583.1 chemotaxis protein CheW [Methylobacterium planeticum]
MPEARSGTGDAAGDRYLVFALGPRLLALPAECVRELVRVMPITPVPGAPAALAGLANLRGVPLPVLDLRRILRAEETPVGTPAYMIVADAGEPIGLLIDRVSGLQTGVPVFDDVTADAAATAGRVRLRDREGTVDSLDLARLLAACFPKRGRRGRILADGGPAPAAQAREAEHVALIRFQVAGRSYALPLEDVAEVVRIPRNVTAASPRDPAVLGTMRLRDRPLRLFSLAARLGLVGRIPDAQARIIVARSSRGDVGLVVETLGPILRVGPEQIDPVPRAFQRGGSGVLAAICRLDERDLISVLSTEHLLKDDTPYALGDHLDAEHEIEGTSREDPGEPFVILDLAEVAYGLPRTAVSEVRRVPGGIIRLPGTPDFVAGMVNLRGEPLPVIDLRRAFDHPPGSPDPRRRLVVLDLDGVRTGFLVDAVSGVLRPRDVALRPAPDLVNDPHNAVTRFGTADDGGQVRLIDPRRLLTSLRHGLRRAGEPPLNARDVSQMAARATA